MAKVLSQFKSFSLLSIRIAKKEHPFGCSLCSFVVLAVLLHKRILRLVVDPFGLIERYLANA